MTGADWRPTWRDTLAHRAATLTLRLASPQYRAFLDVTYRAGKGRLDDALLSAPLREAVAERDALAQRLAEVEGERDRMYENGQIAALTVARVRHLLNRWHEYTDPADLHDDIRAALSDGSDQ